MATIRRRGDTWQVQVRRRGAGAVSKSFKTRTDAMAWARKAEREADLGELPERRESQQTLGDLLKRYVAEVTTAKKGCDPETRRITRLLKDDISKHKLSDLKAEQVTAFRQRRLVAGQGAARHDLIIIRHAISIAMKEWGLPLRSNPCSEIRLPPPSKARTRRLSYEEFEHLLHAADKCIVRWMRPLIEFATETAMRRSELLRLRWCDIEAETGLARLDDTKNGEPREVPLSNRAFEILANLPRTHERIFPITDNSVRLAWPRLTRRAGIIDFHFHDLRHEAISRFIELGLSVPEVALISGHKTPAMLFRYTHLKAETVAEKLRLQK